MSIHHQAMQHLTKAKLLLGSGNEDALRYAALEMRYCIENLFYELIPHYKDELPDTILRNDLWRPADIIDMIAEIDPGVHHDRRLSFGIESSPGVAAREMFVLGTQTGLRRDLARRIYHGLGAYLHARVDRQPHDAVRMRSRLLKLLPRLEQFESDRVIMDGFATRSTFRCEDCDRTISQRLVVGKPQGSVVCPNTKCQAIYDYVDLGGRPAHRMRQENLKCPKCHGDNWFGEHKLRRGAEENATFRCIECGATYRFYLYIMIKDAMVEEPCDGPNNAAG